MSFAAPAGPPPKRHIVVNGGGPEAGSRPSGGAKGGVDNGMKGAYRVYPHIDDLVAVKPDVNALAPIRKLLVQGESYAKQADTHLDFWRPDIALQDYIKASIIAVDFIPRHKDYPELKADRGDLHRLYVGLQKRISGQHERFEGVKDVIKENNIQSGVKPASASSSLNAVVNNDEPVHKARPLSSQSSSVDRKTLGPLSQKNGILSRDGDSALPSLAVRNDDISRPRQKPPVQPKPDGLHGRAIKQPLTANSVSSPYEGDLAARFARLRADESQSSAQDSRIQTRAIFVPDVEASTTKPGHSSSPSLGNNSITQPRLDRPLGPRDMPKVPPGPPRPQKIPLDVEIPSMPKPPDAVYSPAWNTDDPVNLNMLRSSSRNIYTAPSRSVPAAPTNGTRRSSPRPHGRNHYMQPPHNLRNGNAQHDSPGLDFSDSPTVTAMELMGFLKRGFHDLPLLLVDIRNREDFDNGHIMSHSIICIDPIILRRDISAEELRQSLVLSPEAEQSLYDARDSFDLVIYHDQSSTSTEQVNIGTYGEEIRLGDFTKAVYDYGYEKRLKRAPKLLIGGLDAWIDLVGRGALETSQTSGSIYNQEGKNLSQPARKPMARDSRRLSSVRRMTHGSRPLSKEEESKWEAAIRQEEASSNSPDYVRTAEDFLRRYPEPSAIQESMMSPSSSTDHGTSNVSQHNVIGTRHTRSQENDVPLMPPSRPAPALPRQSYSGISERNIPALPLEHRATDTISNQIDKPGVGLYNLGNICYMNSIFQALKGTSALSQRLRNLQEGEEKPPRKKGETTDPKQQLARLLKNMFLVLERRTEVAFNPKTIHDYIKNIHWKERKSRDHFANGGQHDAEEFLGYVLEVLEDEFNFARDKPPLAVLTPSQEEVRRQWPVIRSSWMEWQRFKHTSNSFISENFRGQSMLTQTCRQCKFVTRSWDTWLDLQIEIEDDRQGPRSQTLEDALQKRFLGVEEMDDYRCDHCKTLGSSKREELSRCPEILIIMLRRHKFDEYAARKCETTVTFPLDDLIMDPYFISMDELGSERLDSGHKKPFRYDCYAVVQHGGRNIRAGHYWTLYRDLRKDKKTWIEYNDSRVSLVPDPQTKTQNNQSYILFYQRRPSPNQR